MTQIKKHSIKTFNNKQEMIEEAYDMNHFEPVVFESDDLISVSTPGGIYDYDLRSLQLLKCEYINN